MNIPKEMINVIGTFLVAGMLLGTAGAASARAPSFNAPATPGSQRSAAQASSTQRDAALAFRREQPTTALPARSSTHAAVADTLEHTVRGGQILIIDLPEEIDGNAVDSYAIVRAPALSWLVDYSFMWRTLPEDAGTHEILLLADSPDAAAPLVVRVAVQ